MIDVVHYIYIPWHLILLPLTTVPLPIVSCIVGPQWVFVYKNHFVYEEANLVEQVKFVCPVTEVISRVIKVVVVMFCLQWTRKSFSNFYAKFPMPHPSISTQGTYCFPMVLMYTNLTTPLGRKENIGGVQPLPPDIYIYIYQQVVFKQRSDSCHTHYIIGSWW